VAYVNCECGFLKKDIPDEHIGKKAKCPKCGKSVLVEPVKKTELVPMTIQPQPPVITEIAVASIQQKEKIMSNVTDLKERVSTKNLNFVILSIVTGGIYPILWLYRNYRIIDEITKTKTIDDVFVIWIAALTALSSYFSHNVDKISEATSGLYITASCVLYITYAFRAKESLKSYLFEEFGIDYQMSSFYTFIFHIYYINYCINDIALSASKCDMKKKSDKDVLMQLEKLASLKEKGIISEEEFLAQKTKILNK